MGLTVVKGGLRTLMSPGSSVTSIRPSGKNTMLVGRSRPVARISFWNALVFATFTVTVGRVVLLPAASRATALREWAPLGELLVSHA